MSLSIIIPAYNAAETLEATIGSALGVRKKAGRGDEGRASRAVGKG